MIPVSAVSAGRAPKWEGKVPLGSDIMLDALMERKVAHQAKKFVQELDGGGDKPLNRLRSPEGTEKVRGWQVDRTVAGVEDVKVEGK